MKDHQPGVYGTLDENQRTIHYTYSLDWARMADLARKAARNKSHTAKAGPITITTHTKEARRA